MQSGSDSPCQNARMPESVPVIRSLRSFSGQSVQKSGPLLAGDAVLWWTQGEHSRFWQVASPANLVMPLWAQGAKAPASALVDAYSGLIQPPTHPGADAVSDPL